MGLNEIAKQHHAWVEEMGWHKLTALEALMLVVSECGEAANEVRAEAPTPNFRIELADIILRVLDISVCHDIDIEDALRTKMAINREKGTRGRVK